MKSIEHILKDIRNGRLIALKQDNNSGLGHLFFMAAEFITTSLLHTVSEETQGKYSVVMDLGHLVRLGLSPLPQLSGLSGRKSVLLSLDHESTVTGESLPEQAFTIKKLLDAKSFRHDFRQPGHVVVQSAASGGLVDRRHAVEATVDLMKMTDNEPMAVLWQSTLSESAYQHFLTQHDIALIGFNHIIEYKNSKRMI